MKGGYGTMEELLEMITWSQLGIHNKPVISNPTSLSLSQISNHKHCTHINYSLTSSKPRNLNKYCKINLL